jgi:mRNA interferase HigB
MHVISQKRLREFWQIHNDAESPLRSWHQTTEQAEWESFDDVRAIFGKRVDQVDKFVVFDIGGNKYRLIAVIHYDRQKVYVRHVLTHAEYDRGKWKDD